MWDSDPRIGASGSLAFLLESLVEMTLSEGISRRWDHSRGLLCGKE